MDPGLFFECSSIFLEYLVVEFGDLSLEDAQAVEGLVLEQRLEIFVGSFLFQLQVLFHDGAVGSFQFARINVVEHELRYFSFEVVHLKLTRLALIL